MLLLTWFEARELRFETLGTDFEEHRAGHTLFDHTAECHAAPDDTLLLPKSFDTTVELTMWV